jgi:hypothetical protein
MRKFKGKTVEEIVDSLDPEQKEIIAKLRSLVKGVFPEIVETVKWGNTTFLMGEENLAWIIIYRDHVDFGFFRGAELESKLLEGTGKSLRHIKIRSSNEVGEKELAGLLKRATELEKR